MVFAVVCFFSLFLLFTSDASLVGINYGQLGNNLPSPYESIELIKSMKVTRVKLYDANPEILQLLSGTNIRVSIMIPNNELIDIAANQSVANQWIRKNVLTFYPETKIRFILIGNEVLTSNPEIWPHLVPAMRRLKNSLRSHDIRDVKLSTPLAMDVLETTFPPSNGTFRSDISDSVIYPLLHFLDRTRSFFFIDVYTYFPWSQDPTNIDLDYALLRGMLNYTDPDSGLVYTNLLDQMLDSITFAISKLGYNHIRLVISETGWPHAGDIDQLGANIYNSATYNRNLVKKITKKPTSGTPARPNMVTPAYIFSLFDENQKSGPGTERNWGLLSSDGSFVYEIDVTGKRDESSYGTLPIESNNRPYQGRAWCVVANGADLSRLGNAINYACSEGRGGNGTCDALVPGKQCYEPVSVVAHANYAFSSYWANFKSQGATCYFDGLAQQTTRNPSRGSCKFPSATF